jgi:hypothetical protein
MAPDTAAATGDGSTGSSPEAAGDTIGFGEELDAGAAGWRDAAAELTPGKTLTRVNANARATVTTVAIVGTLLSGLGLVSAQSLLAGGAARWLALMSVGLAMLAVLAGLAYLALRLELVNVQDLGEVERWYDTQFRRARLAVVASWLLVAAVVLAAAAAIVAVAQSGADERPAVDLQLIGTRDARQLQVGVKASDLDEGALVSMRVVAVAGACPEAVLLDGRSTADEEGKVEVSTTIVPLPCNEQFRLDVSGEGVRERSLTVP